MKKMNLGLVLVLGAVGAAGFSGCGKSTGGDGNGFASVDGGAPPKGNPLPGNGNGGGGGGGGTGGGNPPGPGNGNGNGTGGGTPKCANPLSWTYVQPQPTLKRSVDLLFVADTSDSLIEERVRIATTIPAFLNELNAGADVRIAVMLAHGGASSYSGRLYSENSGTPAVMSTLDTSIPQIQKRLEQLLRKAPADRDEANGEASLYSVTRSLQADRLAEIRAQGFYRDEAALSVVFITDENDICFPPELHGYTNFPDYVKNPSGGELKAYHKYCLNPDGTEKITPASVRAGLRALKVNEKLSLAGITHLDPAGVPQKGEDAIGHGILELLALETDGVAFDINQSSYAQGLAALGNVVSSQLDLLLAFILNGSEKLDEKTVSVSVDGIAIPSVYEKADRRARIKASDAGKAGSVVEITACGLSSAFGGVGTP